MVLSNIAFLFSVRCVKKNALVRSFRIHEINIQIIYSNEFISLCSKKNKEKKAAACPSNKYTFI